MRNSKRIYRIEPLADPRWNTFLAGHPRASVFHTLEWLKALHSTYAYDPVAFTTTPPDTELQNAVVFCRVKSLLTGERLVSLPFSDYCDPLVERRSDLLPLLWRLERELHQHKLGYIELRPSIPLEPMRSALAPHTAFCLHQIDLAPDIQTIFENCHKDSIRRKICRARREGIRCEEGRSADLIDHLCRLQLLTRRRHGVPPQPRRWFESLVRHFGEALTIRVAFRGPESIAAILTLRYKHTTTYKYGCSDSRWHCLGGMQLLLWAAIEDARRDDARVFDLGRSDSGNAGLIRFKNRWGARQSTLEYMRITKTGRAGSLDFLRHDGWAARGRRLLACLPDSLFRSAGTFLYRHIG